MGYTRKQLDEARAFDASMARDRFKLQPFKGGRLKRQLSLPAFFNCMRDCPPGTPPEERNKYLADNERLYLDHNEQKSAGWKNRMGRVKEKIVYGKHGEKRVLRCA
jgi:hypothetical protein